MSVVDIGGAKMLLTTSASDNRIHSYLIELGGALVLKDTVGLADYLPITSPKMLQW